MNSLSFHRRRPNCDAISNQKACNNLYKPLTMSPQKLNSKKVNYTIARATTTTCALLVALLAIQLPTQCKSATLLQQQQQQHHLRQQQQQPYETIQQQHLVKQSECSKNPCQNGAVCVNRPDGSYTCLCTAGWQGQNCTENVDDCSMAACENNAKCHDRIGGFVCECPPGKTGLLCQLDDGCFRNPCNANATCDASPVDGHAICTCPTGFSGLDCMIDEDECEHGSPCEHGGTCVNEPGTFRCVCAKGFEGQRCEINIDECAENPCVNSGTCLDERGGFRCVCQPGFTGERCEINIDDCASNPCENNGICKDAVNSFQCMCPAGFWGQHCQFDGKSNVPQVPTTQLIGEVSEPALPPGNPWSKCPQAQYCWTLFHNNNCNEECNNAECLYDGWDCFPQSFNSTLPSFPPTVQQPPANKITPKKCDDNKDSYCLKNYANGICDEECNNPECSWDGLDCDINASVPLNTQAQGLLVIRVEPAIEFDKNNDQKIELAGLIRKVSHATKTVLKVERFNQVEGGTEIELIADTRKCQSSCYNSTELIAKFLTALKGKSIEDFNRQTQSGELKMSDFFSKPKDSTPEAASATTIWVVFCATIATICTVLMVVSIGTKNRVKEKTVVWFPEGFKPVLSSRKRDPTDRKSGGAGGRGISTLQALGGNFFRGIKRNERNISTDPNGVHSTEIDRCTATPNGIYHEPYDQYDQYGSTYTGTDAGSIMNNVEHEPMTPPTMPSNPINIEGPHGLTPLMVASMGQPFSTKEPLGLVAYGTTGEMLESAENNITDLLNRGAQLNLANKVTGETALHLAARHGRVDAARGLLERCDSQDVNAKDASGRTPLHTAIAADSSGVFELLIRCRGTDLNAQTNDGTTPLILATRVGTYSMLEELILNECEVTKSDLNKKTALHWAAATNNVDAIRRLLAVRETNKDAQDLLEETPLFLAAREGAKGAVEILLSHNANKDLCDQMDRSPIEIARSRQHYDIVRLLDDHAPSTPSARSLKGGFVSTPTPLSASRCDDQKPLSHGGRNAERRAMLKSVPNYNTEDFGSLSNGSKSEPEISASLPRRITAPHAQLRETKTKIGATTDLSNYETHCRSISSMHHSTSRQISPFSPISDSNNNTNGPTSIQQPPPQSYHAHSQSGLAEVYNVPCLKNYLTPSPDSPFSLDSMASPPGAYTHQQYQNLHASHHILNTQEQAGVFI